MPVYKRVEKKLASERFGVHRSSSERQKTELEAKIQSRSITKKMVGAHLQTEHRQNCPFINAHVKMPVYKWVEPVYKQTENKIGH